MIFDIRIIKNVARAALTLRVALCGYRKLLLVPSGDHKCVCGHSTFLQSSKEADIRVPGQSFSPF